VNRGEEKPARRPVRGRHSQIFCLSESLVLGSQNSPRQQTQLAKLVSGISTNGTIDFRRFLKLLLPMKGSRISRGGLAGKGKRSAGDLGMNKKGHEISDGTMNGENEEEWIKT